MGTDIHMAAEVRKRGKWHLAEPAKKRCWGCFGFDGQRPGPAREDCWLCHGTGEYTPEPWEGRCYDLFAALANVRNGYGFAGVITGEPIVPIAKPRGLPKDISAEAKEIVNGYHDASWLTFQDLLDYDWDSTIVKHGVIDEATWREWADRGFQGSPTDWSGDVSGPSIVYMDENQLNFRRGMGIPCEKEFPKIQIYTRVKWTSTLRERVGTQWWETMLWLSQLGKPNDVRIVFNFDS